MVKQNISVHTVQCTHSHHFYDPSPSPKKSFLHQIYSGDLDFRCAKNYSTFFSSVSFSFRMTGNPFMVVCVYVLLNSCLSFWKSETERFVTIECKRITFKWSISQMDVNFGLEKRGRRFFNTHTYTRIDTMNKTEIHTHRHTHTDLCV